MSKDILLIDIFLCIILIPNIFRLTAHFVNNRIIKELIENQQYWLSSVLAGYVFAKYDFFEKIKHFHLRIIKSKMINIVLMGITVLFVPLGRVALPYLSLQYKQITVVIMNMDNIYAPIFIYAVVYLCKAIDIKIVKKTLIIIGKKTLLMFLVSSNFFNNCKEIFQPILYYPQNPVLVTIWGLIICFSVSFILDKVIKRLLNRKDKLLGF